MYKLVQVDSTVQAGFSSGDKYQDEFIICMNFGLTSCFSSDRFLEKIENCSRTLEKQNVLITLSD